MLNVSITTRSHVFIVTYVDLSQQTLRVGVDDQSRPAAAVVLKAASDLKRAR